MLCLLPCEAHHHHTAFIPLKSTTPFTPGAEAPVIHASTDASTAKTVTRDGNAVPCQSMPSASYQRPYENTADNASVTTDESVEVHTTCSSPASCAAAQSSDGNRFAFPDEGVWTPSLQIPAHTYTYCQSKTGSWATTCYGGWDSSLMAGDEHCTEQGVPEIIGSDSGVHFF